MQRIFDQSATPLTQKLLQLGEAYHRANTFILFSNIHDWEGMKKTVRDLSPAERNEWAQLWKDVADKHESLSLPKEYYNLLDEAHDATWNTIKKNLPENARTLGFNDRIFFMQKIADAQTSFWQHRFPDIFSNFGGTRVIVATNPVLDQYSLVPSATEGTYEYVVSAIQERFDIWTQVAAHEPQHSVQNHLIKSLHAGNPLPPPLDDAAQIFAFYGAKGAGNLPPSIVCGEDGRPYDDLGHQVGRTYVTSLIETAAFHQGNQMEKAMEHTYPSPTSRSIQNGI